MSQAPATLLLISAILLSSSAAAAPGGQTATLADLVAIRDAMLSFNIDSSLLTTVENLDDTRSSNTQQPWQFINNDGGAVVVNPSVGIPFRQVLSASQFPGPYVSYHNSGRSFEGTSGDYDPGAPMSVVSSYGPIYFYSPLGLIEPRSVDLSLRYYGDEFDEYTLVSHGPDGVKSNDDIIVPVPGFLITVPVLSSARLVAGGTKGAAQPYELVVKGYNLGTNTGDAAVLIDGTPLGGTIQTWTATRIEVATSAIPSSTSLVSIRLSGGSTAMREVAVVNELPPTSATEWWGYE